jgi:hypothetical protein
MRLKKEILNRSVGQRAKLSVNVNTVSGDLLNNGNNSVGVERGG